MKALSLSLFIITFLGINHLANSQKQVEWSFGFDEGKEQLSVKAKMLEGWHIYAIDVNEEIGPVATSIRFNDSKEVKLKGDIIAPKPKEEYDENFGGLLTFYDDEVEFVQEIKVKNETTISGVVTFMTCNNEMCYPPEDIAFEIQIKTNSK